jgi:2-methylcitrate dehydratase PrpD
MDIDDDAVVDGLGARWETERITIKPYPACQLVHAPLDAVRALTAAIDPVDVEQVEVTIPPDSEPIVATPVDGKRRPRSDYEAKFSLPWSVATVLVDGDLTIDAFGARDRAEVLAMADRVTHTVADPGVPAADAPGRVRVTMRDGRVLDGHVASSRGGPSNPLDDDVLVAKFHATADLDGRSWVDFRRLSAGTGPDSVAGLVFGLADLPDLQPLFDTLPTLDH